MAGRQAEMKFKINIELHRPHQSEAPSEWPADLTGAEAACLGPAAHRQGPVESRRGERASKGSTCSLEKCCCIYGALSRCHSFPPHHSLESR